MNFYNLVMLLDTGADGTILHGTGREVRRAGTVSVGGSAMVGGIITSEYRLIVYLLWLPDPYSSGSVVWGP